VICPPSVGGQFLEGGLKRRHLPFIAPANRGDQQVVAALEVLVERGLGDAGRGDDLIDADRVEALRG